MDLPAHTTVYLKDYTPAAVPDLRRSISISTCVSEDDARVAATLVVDRNRKAADPTAGLAARSRRDHRRVGGHRRRHPRARSLHARRPPPDPAERARTFTPDDRQPHQPQAEHQADGDLHLQHRLLQPVRGAGLPAHHALPRPARRDGALHGHAARRQGALSRAARQRQPRRAGRRSRRPALGQVGRPVPEALLPLRRRRRQARPAARTASSPARAARCCCSSSSSPASWTRASSRWSRSSTR